MALATMLHNNAGLLFAALSALFNGTFGMFTKFRQTRAVSPLVINYWVAEGVGISGLLLLAVPPRVFSWYGVLSGMLFVLSTANAVTAIGLIGLSAATGVWCGTAVIVSFAWGVTVAGDQVEHMGQAEVALALILAGIAGIVTAAATGGGHHMREDSELAVETETPHALEAGGEQSAERGLLLTASTAVVPVGARWQSHLSPGTRVVLGLLAAVIAGSVGGLILAPMLAAPAAVRGIQFVPSMAVGAILVAPVVTAILTCTASGITFTQATSSRAAGPGMAAGICWNAGNICCIAAVTNPRIGMAVALPIMQCGLFVAGLWGILLFQEIRGLRPLALYWLSGAVLVGGAALLAAAKGDS